MRRKVQLFALFAVWLLQGFSCVSFRAVTLEPSNTPHQKAEPPLAPIDSNVLLAEIDSVLVKHGFSKRAAGKSHFAGSVYEGFLEICGLGCSKHRATVSVYVDPQTRTVSLDISEPTSWSSRAAKQLEGEIISVVEKNIGHVLITRRK